MRVQGLLILGSLLGLGSASTPHVLHEKRNLNNKRWAPVSTLDPGTVLPFRIGLKQGNLEKGDSWLYEVSHPASPNYGKHWSAEQVKDAFKPSPETVKAVHDWLHAAGIHRDRHQLSEGLNWLEFDATVAEAEDLLKTKYQLFEHESTSTHHIACDHYSLPSHIREHVDFVSPGVHFDAKTTQGTDTQFGADGSILEKRSWKGPTRHHNPGPIPHHGGPRPWQPKQGSQICNVSFVDPACLRLLYDVPENVKANAKNSLGIVEYAPESYLGSDLDLFFKAYAPDQVGERPIFDAIDGGYLFFNFTEDYAFDYLGEPSLDLQYSMALAYPQKVTLYQTGDLVEGASFNNFLDAIDASYCTYDGGDDPNNDAVFPDPYPGPGSYKGPENCGTYAPAKVISTSYAYNEIDLPDAYEVRQCHEYMKLGLMGTTFVYSSADYGVAGNAGHCLNANGTYNNGLSGQFVPTFPSTCPYVLSAGATQIQNNSYVDFDVDRAIERGEEVEEAMELTLTPQGLIGYDFPQNENPTDQIVFSSSGGFSNVFALPKYQASTVKAWFKEHNPGYSSAVYNNSGTTRAFPDISANGAWYSIAVDGELSQVFGTSCAAPVIAAILALINGERLNAGKSSVGFINPTLYANPQILHDITLGANPGCGTRGFSAVKGWDPVTGLGTPNYPEMLKLFLSLP